jgi:hypothetical protein
MLGSIGVDLVREALRAHDVMTPFEEEKVKAIP